MAVRGSDEEGSSPPSPPKKETMPYKDPTIQRQRQREISANKTVIRRFIAIEFLGGECVNCKISDHRCLQFDHINPILRRMGYGEKAVTGIYMDRENLDNLQLLCANCHMIKTYAEDKMKYAGYLGH